MFNFIQSSSYAKPHDSLVGSLWHATASRYASEQPCKAPTVGYLV